MELQDIEDVCRCAVNHLESLKTETERRIKDLKAEIESNQVLVDCKERDLQNFEQQRLGVLSVLRGIREWAENDALVRHT